MENTSTARLDSSALHADDDHHQGVKARPPSMSSSRASTPSIPTAPIVRPSHLVVVECSNKMTQPDLNL